MERFMLQEIKEVILTICQAKHNHLCNKMCAASRFHIKPHVDSTIKIFIIGKRPSGAGLTK